MPVKASFSRQKSSSELKAQFQGLLAEKFLRDKDALRIKGVTGNQVLDYCGEQESKVPNGDKALDEKVRKQLKQLSQTERKSVLNRRKTHAKYIDSYDQDYQSQGMRLNFKLQLAQDPQDITDDEFEFLGIGRFGTTFRDKATNAVYKSPYQLDSINSVLYFFEEVDNFIACQGLPCVNKLQAYSIEDKLVVSDYVDGDCFVQITEDSLNAVTDEQIDDLITTIKGMHEKGFYFDPNFENILYNPKEGFKFVDLGSGDTRSYEFSILYLLYSLIMPGREESKDSSNEGKVKARINLTNRILKKSLNQNDQNLTELNGQISGIQARYQHGFPRLKRNLEKITTTPWLNKDQLLERMPNLKKDIEELTKTSEAIVFDR